MRKRILTLMFLGALAGAIALPVFGDAPGFAKNHKVAVCHYDDDGVTSDPKTLWVGSQKAADKHVANHTVDNGHEGDDTLGACPP